MTLNSDTETASEAYPEGMQNSLVGVPGIEGELAAENETVRNAFLKWGRQSSAYFVFQEGVKRFDGSQGGQVHYAVQKTPLGSVNLVFTNPLCHPGGMPHLLMEFEQAATVPNVYVAVNDEVANCLQSRAYNINRIGTESRITLGDFNVRGKKKKQLRHASHFGERVGAQVQELMWDEVDADQVKTLSLQWRASKGVKRRELKYATRPPVYGDEWGVRKFYCKHNGRVIAFVFFDPYFEQGQLKGYCANILRSSPSKEFNGALDYTILEAINVFRREGVSELSLGIAPLQNIQPNQNERRSIRLISRLFYDYGNRLYSFRGLAYHKSRYRPIETPWYLCSRQISLFRLYWALLFGLKVLGPPDSRSR